MTIGDRMMKTLRCLLANGGILSILLGVQLPILAALAGMHFFGIVVSCLAGVAVAGGLHRFLSRWNASSSGISSLVHCMAWGNIGMLVGWWMDAGFQPVVRDMACFCECLKSPGWGLTMNWMQLLMLLGCLLPCIPDLYKKRHGWLEVLVSLGLMDTGMLLASWLAGSLEIKIPVFAFYISFFAMSTGMLLGTSLAHWIFRYLHHSLTTHHYEQSYR